MRHQTTFSRRRMLALGGALALTPVIGRAAPLVRASGLAFGTSWTASLPDNVVPDAFAAQAADLLAGLDAALSPWRADSSVSAFNRAAGEVAAGPDLTAVAQSALKIAEASGGQFDPTVGPLVARYGFGPITEGSDRPDWRQVGLDGARLVKAVSGATFDPCGIAKGYALDRLATLAQGHGVASGFIEFGGEVTAWGRHPEGRAWRAGVEDPRAGGTGLLAVLRIDGALATSGNKVNGYDFADRTYGHIIAPDAAGPRASALLSVTLRADTAMEADGWATALMAAGADGARGLAEAHDLDALLILAGSDAPKLVATGLMPDLIERT
ncbi:FAD:protein FMN transferase [Mesobacterium pallidum]|uniref:FAD:protein FMN transferase n=1 Tax=Mesobacterium pallidum TaxID=2872037 RepID=UPI001EE15DE0|nr:FAD:protein FMN transferase [Mesobacterium pallidum]